MWKDLQDELMQKLRTAVRQSASLEIVPTLRQPIWPPIDPSLSLPCRLLMRRDHLFVAMASLMDYLIGGVAQIATPHFKA